MVDNEQDLQTYLDKFDEEQDELGEGVEVLTETEAMSQNILSDDGRDPDTLFMDQDGNYYFEETASTTKADGRSTSTIKRITRATKKKVPDAGSGSANTKRKSPVKPRQAEIDYVVIMEDDDDAPSSKVTEDGDDNDEEECDYDDDDTKSIVLKKKVRMSPDESEHRCAHCPYSTTKRYLLLRHMKVHSDDRPFKCSVCERGFRTNCSLQNHLNSHLGHKPHACKNCDMCFTTAGELVRHTRYRHTGEKPHKCSECDYSSVELSKLRRHIRCHTGERPYQCPHCTYASPDTFKLKRHLRTHTGEKPYECDICHARFTQSNSLKAHRLIHSVGDKPIFQCTLCPTTCGRKTDLRLHIQKLHHSEQPIKCKRCGKELPDRYSYKVHLKTHDGEKCYRCTVCPYASISMRHLESHMLVHTDEKPFVCETCLMSFRQSQLLKRHINIYHNKDYVPPAPREKTHFCPHCKRTFTHKGNLLRHMEVHDPDTLRAASQPRLKQQALQHKEKLLNFTASDDENILVEEDIANDDLLVGVDGEEYDDENYEIIVPFDDVVDETYTSDTDAKEDAIDKDEIVIKQEVFVKKENCSVANIKNTVIKKENAKELMAADDTNAEEAMYVEVIQCEDDEDLNDDAEEDNIVVREEDLQMAAPSSNGVDRKPKQHGKGRVNNCFGFDEDADNHDDQDDRDDDELEFLQEDDETKTTIQFLELIDGI